MSLAALGVSVLFPSQPVIMARCGQNGFAGGGQIDVNEKKAVIIVGTEHVQGGDRLQRQALVQTEAGQSP